MTSFAEIIVRVADCQKVCDSFVNAKQKLGNVLLEGEHLLSSCMVDRRRLNTKEVVVCSTRIVWI